MTAKRTEADCRRIVVARHTTEQRTRTHFLLCSDGVLQASFQDAGTFSKTREPVIFASILVIFIVMALFEVYPASLEALLWAATTGNTWNTPPTSRQVTESSPQRLQRCIKLETSPQDSLGNSRWLFWNRKAFCRSNHIPKIFVDQFKDYCILAEDLSFPNPAEIRLVLSILH